MTRKRKVEIGSRTRRNINLNYYKKKLEEITNKGKEEYSPKLGRRAKQVKKQIQKIEKNVRTAVIDKEKKS